MPYCFRALIGFYFFWFSNIMALGLPDEDYSMALGLPDEDYSMSLSLPDEDYSRNG